MARKDEKTEQIIEAATKEFLEKGLNAASMHKIAERAEVSTRTLYKYFPTKEDLFAKLVNELLDSINFSHLKKFTNTLPLKEQLEAFIEEKIAIITTDSYINMSKIVVGEFLKSKTLTAEQLEKMAKSDSYFINWIKDAMKNSAITSDYSAEKAAALFHSVLKGQVFYPRLFGLKQLTEEDKLDTKKLLVDFFLNNICKSNNLTNR